MRHSSWIPYYRFHLRRLWKTQPAAFCALLVAFAACVSMLGAYLEQLSDRDAVERAWRALRSQGLQTMQDSASLQRDSGGRPILPAFKNTLLVDALNRVTEETKLPLDEVSFSFDENLSQPYVRYHASLTVTAGYPAIRRFLERLRTDQPNTSLDSITCSREDITTVDLTCDLVLSAFYRKRGNG